MPAKNTEHKILDSKQHLHKLLKSFGKFRGAKAEFVIKYNDQTGKNYGKNLVNKILKDEINFSRNEELSLAIKVAEKLHLDYTYNKSGGAFHLLIQDVEIVNKPMISDMVELADSMFARGENRSAYELLIKLTARIDMKQLARKDEFLSAYLHLVIGKVKMQAGIVKGTQSALSHIDIGYQTFKKQDEFEHLRAATSIRGHVYRQLDHIYDAKRAFEDIIKIAQTFDQQRRLDVIYNTDHQLALTLAHRHHEIEGKTDLYLNQAITLMQRSNLYFKNQEHQSDWYRFALIREAELLLTQGNVSEAGSIIEQFERSGDILLLDVGKQVIFLRLRCSWHIQNHAFHDASRDFTTAHKLATTHEFNKELMSLKLLFFAHPEMRKYLSNALYQST